MTVCCDRSTARSGTLASVPWENAHILGGEAQGKMAKPHVDVDIVDAETIHPS